MNNDEPKLLPCPFCGREPAFNPACFDGLVSCACGISFTSNEDGFPSAVERWNTRHTPEPDTAPKVDEQLEKDIGRIKRLIDFSPEGHRDTAIARTILHLLKR